ncbi:MAG: hypothetical protein JJT90_15955 [Ectothiorhodospiraceae bacterium]|nr:hypothetical protein [Ectothiorhodospiraceae bacterium]
MWLDAAYRGATGEQGAWRAAADALRQQVDGRETLILAVPEIDRFLIEGGVAGCASATAEAHLSRWLARHRDALQRWLRRQAAGSDPASGLWLPRGMDPWDGLLSEQPVHHNGGCMVVVRRLPAGGVVGLGFGQGSGAAPTPSAFRAAAAELCGQLSTVVHAGLEVRRLREGLADIQILLSQWHVLVLRCDSAGYVIDAVGTLRETLWAYRRVARLRRRRLWLADEPARKRLAQLLACPGYSSAYAGPSLSVRAEGLPPLEIVVLASTAPSTEPDSRLLIVRRQPMDVRIDRSYLRHRLGLTRGQADVLCRLMQGQDIGAIARARGSRHETIRGYLRELRRRLSCHSQAQLVAAGWAAVAHVPTVLMPSSLDGMARPPVTLGPLPVLHAPPPGDLPPE